jgi:hypothetical protein
MKRFAVLVALAFIVGGCSPEVETTNNKQLRERTVSRLQFQSFGSVRSRLQEVRPRYHNHLHNIVHAKGRALTISRGRARTRARTLIRRRAALSDLLTSR